MRRRDFSWVCAAVVARSYAVHAQRLEIGFLSVPAAAACVPRVVPEARLGAHPLARDGRCHGSPPDVGDRLIADGFSREPVDIARLRSYP